MGTASLTNPEVPSCVGVAPHEWKLGRLNADIKLGRQGMAFKMCPQVPRGLTVDVGTSCRAG